MSFEIKRMKSYIKLYSIRWKLNSLEKEHLEISPKFQLENSEYRLIFKNVRKFGVFHSIIDIRGEIYKFVPSRVTVEVESPVTRQILPSLTVTVDDPSKHLVLYNCSIIWRKEKSEIEAACPDFARKPELTFIVTLEAEQSKTLTDEKSVQTSLCIDPTPCSESLSEDFGKFLNSDLNPDVDFQCDGQSTKAHRLVVSARSPVLAKMLQSQMVEGRTGVIKIEDMDLDTLKLFVRYLYTGTMEETPTFEAAMGLYEAADKYEVKSLARRCAQSLMESLTVQNACDVLDVADRHSDDKFVEEVVAFILEKKVPSTSKHWRAFCSSHPLLAIEVQNRYIEEQNQYIEELIGSSTPPRKKLCTKVSAE